jgi:hypothetical protein
MELPHQNKNHSNVDITHLVWQVANKVKDEELQNFQENRPGNSRCNPIVDILATGEKKLKSSSLSTFNRKVLAMVEGRMFEIEVDEIPSVSFSEDPEVEDRTSSSE